MEGTKGIVVVLVVLAAAVGAIIFGITRMRKSEEAPTWMDTQPAQKIDVETYKMMTKTNAEWKKLGQQNGKYLNPKTGKYNMVRSKRCASCRERIPVPDGVNLDRLTHDDIDNTMCPLCGGPQFPADLLPGRGMEGRPE